MDLDVRSVRFHTVRISLIVFQTLTVIVAVFLPFVPMDLVNKVQKYPENDSKF